jgi:hypothetical protein
MKRLTALLLLNTCVAASFYTEASLNYDGRWWLSVSKEERHGFIEGYAGCYLNDTDGKVRFTESSYAYEPRLTEYLKKNPSAETIPIEESLWKMAMPPYAQTVKRMSGPAEEHKGKYGYLDGDYWRQSQNSERTGLIEGFLYCYSKHAKAPVGTFSRPASYYVNAISNWYGVKSDDPGEIDPARMGTKIPHSLFKFRDKAPPHQ